MGFQQAGFNLVLAVDNWDAALTQYRKYFKHDALKHDLHDVAGVVNLIKPYKPDIIIGGPPCQDFSEAGSRKEGARAQLTSDFASIVSQCQTDYFVMENVANIRKSKAFPEVLANFKKAGYGVTQRVLDAAFCGVPQTRKRMFVIGAQGEKDDFLGDELDGALAKKPMSIYDYLGDSLGTEYYFRVPTNYTRRAVFSIHEPSMTIRAVDRPIPSGYKGNANDSAPLSEARCLTPKERSYIQTFPKGFKFSGCKTDQNQMIGNAVPVNLAKFVGAALLRYVHAKVKGENNASR